ncbi:hypothetical protein GCM10009422_07130 [Brevundimonas kwangchunensis]|uniref:Uncharacterized protein n=1 Tax=Brevundimonas kwangchunensis TaxID=322163 RepID=A0ABP3RUK2_9CAUL
MDAVSYGPPEGVQTRRLCRHGKASVWQGLTRPAEALREPPKTHDAGPLSETGVGYQ